MSFFLSGFSLYSILLSVGFKPKPRMHPHGRLSPIFFTTETGQGDHRENHRDKARQKKIHIENPKMGAGRRLNAHLPR